MGRIVLLALLFCFCFFGTVFSAPVEWTIDDGGNGHWYEVVLDPAAYGGWSWQEASGLAEASSFNGLQGHLVTVTSEAENDFISSSSFLGGAYGGLFADTIWLGGYQDPDATSLTDGWHWITGETWGYTDWAGTSPNSLSENYLAMAAGSVTPAGGWHDLANTGRFWRDMGTAYIIEYEALPVPVPGAVFLLASGLIGFAGLKRNGA